jgi:hypothetical protein
MSASSALARARSPSPTSCQLLRILQGGPGIQLKTDAQSEAFGALLEIPPKTKEIGRDYDLGLAASNARRALLPAEAGPRMPGV